jgi:streptomycin 6-kinase
MEGTAPRSAAAETRLESLASEWRVKIDAVDRTATSLIAFGVCHDERVVLKVVHEAADEWHSGAVLAAFGGGRFARVLRHRPGAVLMERLEPGADLTGLVRDGHDDEATAILASIAAQRPAAAPASATRAETWIDSFRRYSSSGDGQIAAELLDAGLASYARLCATQTAARLLHGDLQHYNVLSSARGWVAIDPKGIVAEVAFEAGALLRNPHSAPHLMNDAGVVRQRAARFAQCLELDPRRVLEWGFAQAVLSLVWSREDGHAIQPGDPAFVLARALLPEFA